MRTVCKLCSYEWWDGPQDARCPHCGSEAKEENRYRDSRIVLVPAVAVRAHGNSGHVHLRTVGSIWAGRYRREPGQVLCHGNRSLLVDVQGARPTCPRCLEKWHALEGEHDIKRA